MNKLSQEFRQDIQDFKKTADQFFNHEMSTKEYKGISGGYGTYAQADPSLSMLRLRFTGGRVSPAQMKCIANKLRQHDISLLHFTTCQCIQLHNLSKDVLLDTMDAAYGADIIPRGTGGDFPRNVTVSPLSGVQTGEYFDVSPYAQAAGTYLLSILKSIKLPRKLKVGFANSAANDTHATFRDLGFAANADGTFDVFSGGGLGNNYKWGLPVGTHVDPNKILYYVQAMVQFFMKYGNYENRAKARSRYIQETLGTDGYIQAFHAELAQVQETKQLDLTIAPPILTGMTAIAVPPTASRIQPQKQDGLYYVSWHPYGGNPPIDVFCAVSDALQDIPNAELRVGPDETVYFINLPASDAEMIAAITENSSAKTLVETSVSCIGHSICQAGMQDSQALLHAILAAILPCHFADKVLPRFYISGCTSSCGTHQIGMLGFRGAIKQEDGNAVPAFTLYADGTYSHGKEQFATPVATIAAARIPEFVVALGKQVSQANTTFEKWYIGHEQDLTTLAEQFA